MLLQREEESLKYRHGNVMTETFECSSARLTLLSIAVSLLFC